RAIICSPEAALQNGHLTKYWAKLKSQKIAVRLVLDEAHCVMDWAKFRQEYKHMLELKANLPSTTSVYVTSATLTSSGVETLKTLLGLRPHRTMVVRRSNNRPNLGICV
ncbi:hypothetical protein SISSUDRAFT_956983, partial [Sistotremastrum suecicum HHB10207 ss-3]